MFRKIFLSLCLLVSIPAKGAGHLYSEDQVSIPWKVVETMDSLRKQLPFTLQTVFVSAVTTNVFGGLLLLCLPANFDQNIRLGLVLSLIASIPTTPLNILERYDGNSFNIYHSDCFTVLPPFIFVFGFVMEFTVPTPHGAMPVPLVPMPLVVYAAAAA